MATLNQTSDPYMQCAGFNDPCFTEVADDDSFFDELNELVLDPKTGQVDKKAMARKKARKEANKGQTADTSKSRSYNMLKGFPNTTKNASSNVNKLSEVKRPKISVMNVDLL